MLWVCGVHPPPTPKKKVCDLRLFFFYQSTSKKTYSQKKIVCTTYAAYIPTKTCNLHPKKEVHTTNGKKTKSELLIEGYAATSFLSSHLKSPSMPQLHCFTHARGTQNVCGGYMTPSSGSNGGCWVVLVGLLFLF